MFWKSCTDGVYCTVGVLQFNITWCEHILGTSYTAWCVDDDGNMTMIGAFKSLRKAMNACCKHYNRRHEL